MQINVLWIEDTTSWLRSAQERLAGQLKKRDFDLKTYRSKHGENISRYLSKPIDFALCDFNLKEGEADLSLEMVRKIRTKNRYCQIIFYSSDADIPADVFAFLVRTAKCRYVPRNEVIDVVIEELESGLSIYSVVDKWLTYYGKDKGSFTFSLFGKEFARKSVLQLKRSVRRGDDVGRRFSLQLTKHMLSLLVD